MDESGTTFLSHSLALDETPDQKAADITLFAMEEVSHQLTCHISGLKSRDKEPFTSHWISTTDSWEAALNRAERHYSKGSKNVTIYVIDTNTLLEPVMPLLMFLAARAWNLRDIVQWRAEMFKYGSLTEWIFWDKIRAAKVDKIDYASFSRPKRNAEQGWTPQLSDLAPKVLKAARIRENKRSGMSRPALHASLYHSKREEKELEVFEQTAFVGRYGKLPKAPKAAQKDTRASVNDKVVEDVWNLVQTCESRNTLFVWLLSLMTKQYYHETIVESIVRQYPDVVMSNLELATEIANGGLQKVLAHYLPGPNCFGRDDVEHYQKMVRACIVQWDLVKHRDTSHPYYGVPVYIVTGEHRPMRNLVRLRQQGLLGRCTSENMLLDSCPSVKQLSYHDIIKYGRKIQQPETDEEYRERMHQDYDNKFYAPEGLPISTSRVRKSQALNLVDPLSRSRSPGGFLAPDPATRALRSTALDPDCRLRAAKSRVPPTTGNSVLDWVDRDNHDNINRGSKDSK